MKALLIADDEKAITNISEVLKTAGYDVIVYKWLLKAMDNIEEIAPHLIVISTKDYPRHWKTLAQFSTTIAADYTPEIILYAEEPLSEQEEKKAVALHVRGIFDSCEVEGLDTLRKILAKKKDIFSGLLTEPEQSEVTLQDLLPELSDLSKDIDSLKEDLKKPFNIDEAIAQAKKAQTEEAEKEETLQDNGQKENSAQNPSETEEETGAETIPDEAVSAETASPEIKTSEAEESPEFKTEKSGENEPCQNEDKKSEAESETQKTGTEKNTETEIPAPDTEMPDRLEPSLKISPENQDEPSPSAQESEFPADKKESSVVDAGEEAAEKESGLSDKSGKEPSQSDLAKTENIKAQVKSDIIEEKSEKEDSEMNENDIEAKLAAIMSANKTEAKEKVSETGIGKFSCSFAFTNPITLAMVTGTARNYNGLTLEFTPDIPSFIANLSSGTKIDVASLKINGEISDVKCEIMSNDSDKIYLQIKSK